jgi:uncharacterized protein
MRFPFSTTRFLLSILILLTGYKVYGNSIFDLPTPDKFVNDYAGLLSDHHVTLLERKVNDFDVSTSTQIAIVTVKNLEGLEPAVFAHRLAEQWGVGQENKDNGVLILVKPKYTHEKGQVYIAVGYGLEHIIPDAKAKRIVNNILIPNFKRNKFYQGLDKSIDSIIQLSTGEFTSNDRSAIYIDNYILTLIIIGLTLLLLPIFYLIYARNRKVPEEYAHHYIKGDYKSENLINQINLMEHKFGKSYPKFKNLVRRFETISRNNLIKYADKLDRHLFCYLLDGRKRSKLFWEMADPFLKFIFLYVIAILLTTCGLLFYHFGILAFLLGLGLSFIVIYGLFGFLISFLEIYQFILRKNAKFVGGISIGLFALNTLFKRNIKRKYNSATNSYTYYPHVVYYSAGLGGGYGGGFGGGGGGFGGGGFGGGGAGGSW